MYFKFLMMNFADAIRAHLTKAKTLLIFTLPVKSSRGLAACMNTALSQLTPVSTVRNDQFRLKNDAFFH